MLDNPAMFVAAFSGSLVAVGALIALMGIGFYDRRAAMFGVLLAVAGVLLFAGWAVSALLIAVFGAVAA